MPGTLKDNIIFGKPFEEEKFNEVIKVTQLSDVIQIMDDGIETIISNKLPHSLKV